MHNLLRRAVCFADYSMYVPHTFRMFLPPVFCVCSCMFRIFLSHMFRVLYPLFFRLSLTGLQEVFPAQPVILNTVSDE